jgi:RNA polymerase sigma-70 factor (ECF subfamily)
MHYDRLFKFAYKWCGVRVDAEDITQQACIKIARSIQQFRFDAAFSSWLYRIVINCAKDWQRSQSRHVANPDEMNARESDCVVDSGAENELLLRQVMRHIDTMAEGTKETLLLVYGEGHTHGEAADILEVKESTISWRLHEVRKQLRLVFDQEALYD